MRSLLVVLLTIVLPQAAGACDFLDPSIPFRKDATIYPPGHPMSHSYGLEEHGDIRGHNYTLAYHDGTFAISSFEVMCGTDAIKDFRWCVAEAGDLHINHAQGYGTWVNVGREHYPGTDVTIRPDKRQPFSTPSPGWTGKRAGAILAAMQSAKTVTTRYHKWPYKHNIDNTIPVDVLDQVLAYMKFAVAQKSKSCQPVR